MVFLRDSMVFFRVFCFGGVFPGGVLGFLRGFGGFLAAAGWVFGGLFGVDNGFGWSFVELWLVVGGLADFQWFWIVYNGSSRMVLNVFFSHCLKKKKVLGAEAAFTLL